MWQYHFKGHDNLDDNCSSTSNMESVRDYTPQSMEEDDEEMMVVRGCKPISGQQKKSSYSERYQAKEFTLCDYYLVHGNNEHFKVYTLTKKRGKLTMGVSTCILDYDTKACPMIFTSDTVENITMVARNLKVQNVLGFCAALCHQTLRQLLTLKTTQRLNLYSLLKHIGYAYQQQSNFGRK